MDEDKNRRIATFRFGVIHDLVEGVELSPGEQERLIREKCGRKWVIPFSDKTRITRSTILRWVKLYRDSGNKLEARRIMTDPIGARVARWIPRRPWP